MPNYIAPVVDTNFVLQEVLRIEDYSTVRGFGDLSADLVRSILQEGARFVEDVIQPLNQVGDRVGCLRENDGSVVTPPGFKEAYDQFCEDGWNGLQVPTDFGGQGMPHVISTAFEEYMISANMAFTMYPGLTQGAIGAIRAIGSLEDQQAYIPKMAEGAWSGTMNLTEAHCGTDLGLIRSKAEPQADGSFKLTGTKMFISSGEHDLTENIIHLVLAKIVDAPDNVRGISMFVVPKFLINKDGSIGDRNNVSCGALEKKMGINGNATCLMNFDDATAYLIGEREQGMRAMFVMMNSARLQVGLQGLSISEVATQNAAAYARDRLQGRSSTGPQHSLAGADSIIVHPDVRRMLMNARAFNEAGRAVALWGALQVDLTERLEDSSEREKAEDLIGFLTPVIKSFFTDKAFENVNGALQCFGGHGYIKEWGMEQFVRDVRIAMIYEGTNGIQALDLVGRKLPANGGRAVRRFISIIASFIAANREDEVLGKMVGRLEQALSDLQEATNWITSRGIENPNDVGAASVPYLNLVGLVLFGYMWGRIVESSLRGINGGVNSVQFYQDKITTAKYFYTHILSETQMFKAKIKAGSENMMRLKADAF